MTYPGYQRFFLACDGELRFVGRRPKTRAAKPAADLGFFFKGGGLKFFVNSVNFHLCKT